MKKAVFIFATVLAAFLVNSNCAFFAPRHKPQAAAENSAESAAKLTEKKPIDTKWHNYGAYLAGHMAALRVDLDKASDYFMIAEKDAPQNLELPMRLSLMLAMAGRVDEAAVYAEEVRSKRNDNTLINFILSAKYFKDKRYQKALDELDFMKGDFIYSLLSAWNYAAMEQKDQALSALEPLKKSEGMLPMYYFQTGAICDLLGDNDCAEQAYEEIIDTRLTALPLLAVANFYMRNGDSEQAIALAKKSVIFQSSVILEMVNWQLRNGKKGKPILTPELGMADSLLYIAVAAENIGKSTGQKETPEAVLLLTALSSYVAPDYVMPYLYIGKQLEERELWQQAIDAYGKVKPDNLAYYGAQLAIGIILQKMKKYDEAAELFRKLEEIRPDSWELHILYADALRSAGKCDEAIKYYKLSLKDATEYDDRVPVVNLSIGICYSYLGDYAKSEEYLRQVVKDYSDPIVQNYLGYVLLQQNKNIEEAFRLIASAYKKSPREGSFVDSLGWAFYKIGRYQEAEKYLETAVDLSVSEAVIYDHLGDVYWQNGRHDEAIHQWNHALGMKDTSGELKRDVVLDKIKHGLPKPTVLPYDSEQIESILQSIVPAAAAPAGK